VRNDGAGAAVNAGQQLGEDVDRLFAGLDLFRQDRRDHLGIVAGVLRPHVLNGRDAMLGEVIQHGFQECFSELGPRTLGTAAAVIPRYETASSILLWRIGHRSSAARQSAAAS
jgi:hypothetical protein